MNTSGDGGDLFQLQKSPGVVVGGGRVDVGSQAYGAAGVSQTVSVSVPFNAEAWYIGMSGGFGGSLFRPPGRKSESTEKKKNE